MNDNKTDDLYTSSPRLTCSVLFLLRTSQSITEHFWGWGEMRCKMITHCTCIVSVSLENMGSWPKRPILKRSWVHVSLIHLPVVPQICVGELGQHLFRKWLVAYSVPSHYLNQCWNIAFGPLGTNLGENLIEIIIFSFKKMRFKMS